MSQRARSVYPLVPAIIGWVLLSTGEGVLAATDDLMQFFEEEAKVVTASKRLEGITDAPGVVTVVTKHDIEAFGSVSLVDILNRVPSLQVMSSHLWVQAKSVIRGDLITHTDTHVLLLIDGRPFRERQEGTGDYTLYTTFPVELIERIEVIRGPGSVLYGSNAVAGVINIVTKKAEEPVHAMPLKVKYTGGVGSFGATLNTVSAYAKGEAWNLSMAYNAFQEDGWDFAAWTSHPVLPSLFDETHYSENNKSVSGFFDYRDRLTAKIFYSGVQYRALGTLPYWDNEADVDSRRLFVDLGYRQPLSETWDLKLNVTRNDYDKGINYIRTGLSEPDQSVGTLLEISIGGAIGQSTNLIMGLIREDARSVNIVETIPGVQRALLPDGFNDQTTSGYVQVDHRVIPPLKLTAGAQYNRIDSGEDDIVPRVGAIYDITDSVGLKVLYAEAFRGPTAQERFSDVPNLLQGNPNLVPETVTTTDAQIFANTANAQYALTYFTSHMKDLIVRVPLSGSTQTFANFGDKTIWGLELEAKVQVSEPIYVIGSGTYQDEKDDTLYIPHYMAKMGIGYQREHLTGGVFYSVFGEPKENTGTKLNTQAAAIQLLSLNLTYKFTLYTPMAFNLYASNLLNDDMAYTEFSKGWVNTLPIGSGRAVYGRLTVAF